jgi:hypothetical protein
MTATLVRETPVIGQYFIDDNGRKGVVDSEGTVWKVKELWNQFRHYYIDGDDTNFWVSIPLMTNNQLLQVKRLWKGQDHSEVIPTNQEILEGGHEFIPTGGISLYGPLWSPGGCDNGGRGDLYTAAFRQF